MESNRKYLWALALAELHAASDMESFTVWELERGECCLEQLLHQIILVRLRPTHVCRTNASQKRRHHLKLC